MPLEQKTRSETGRYVHWCARFSGVIPSLIKGQIIACSCSNTHMSTSVFTGLKKFCGSQLMECMEHIALDIGVSVACNVLFSIEW